MTPYEQQQRLCEIFSEAAAKSTGAAQPKFQRVSDAYQKMVDITLSGTTDMSALNAPIRDFAEANNDLISYLQTSNDVEAIQVYNEMSLKAQDVAMGRGSQPSAPPPRELPPAKENPVVEQNNKPQPPKKPPHGHFRL